ncbi:XF1762 family protein [Streptomyces sp. NRRL S-350]|uniref:XF1762 family protein n=1 Tax=Streptomyces sp. NRRL S-350 TaxID=1463902 RepID=UPI0004BFDE93|nr:XF1762 family protein [Streptomyces sp. NRRL S-350]
MPEPTQRRLRIRPLSFAAACAFVTEHHRHHAPPQGHKFSLAVVAEPDDQVVGVAIVGRPVARPFDDGLTLEVTRVATDGTANACSALYGAAWRTARAAGYQRLVTYTQEEESGASLRAAGWRLVARRRPRPGWNVPSRPRRLQGTENTGRLLWENTTQHAPPLPQAD